ncbi:pectin lyase fold/virulence factor [Syncephalastrum racemosum]|uniref:Pectin lyase fold/virulence factor n=1 Tax=Syncephalastrum racemosum TaxID=13706 RepID=A0A1X2H685_SYNRA|nr:pectin lyase fold/virulence factor [Syncephalastrum racemosum]
MRATSILLFAGALAQAAFAAPTHTKKCVIPTSSGDASEAIVSTFERCKKDSTIVFEKHKVYHVEKPMNITGLDNVHISLEGTILFSDDMTYWVDNMYLLNYQSAGTWWFMAGNDIRIDGGGTIDGNAQVWWNAEAKDPRPVALTFENVTGLEVSDILMTQVPFWTFLMRDTKNAVFENLRIRSYSNSQHAAHNSDGFDVYRSENVTIRNSEVINNDDCVSIRANSTNILIENLYCFGSHGISVGSLGQYARDGEYDFASNIYVHNITCDNCQNGARVKAWNGGTGYVSNVTFDDFEVTYVDNPIVITTHYCDNNQPDYCNGDETQSLTFKDITFNNVYGFTSDAAEPIININCSSKTPCENIQLTKINIKPADTTPDNICVNLSGSDDISLCSSKSSS